MNIYIVTFANGNYGSLLQAYALQSRLREFGAAPCLLLESNPKRRSKLHSIWRIIKPQRHYTLFQRVQRKIQSEDFKGKKDKMTQFFNKNLSVSVITDKRAFVQNLSSEDVFIAGSDQIWNILNKPLSKWYSLQWVDNRCRKYSYAASIGLSTLTEQQKREYTFGLSAFRVLSFRETDAVNALSSCFSGNIRQDIDPTLLYDACFWRKIEAPQLVEHPYIFVYMLRPNMEVINMARSIAKVKGCKIIFTGQFADRFEGTTTVCDAGVEEFLSYIDHAQAVVTNSFHGTVFSILFEKPFLSVRVSSTGSRAESLLKLLNLEAQLVENVHDSFSLEINYSPVKSILANEREKSLDYLRSICAFKV